MEISELSGSAPYGAAFETAEPAAVTTGRPVSAAASDASSGGLSMTDFLKLLAAQFKNQDIMNPTDNTEYISELAQFSSIQAMNTLTSYADRQYAASLVGKTVRVSKTDTEGKRVFDIGKVGYVDFSSMDGTSAIVVNGQAYDLSSVIQVLDDATQETAAGGGGQAGPAGG